MKPVAETTPPAGAAGHPRPARLAYSPRTARGMLSRGWLCSRAILCARGPMAPIRSSRLRVTHLTPHAVKVPGQTILAPATGIAISKAQISRWSKKGHAYCSVLVGRMNSIRALEYEPASPTRRRVLHAMTPKCAAEANARLTRMQRNWANTWVHTLRGERLCWERFC
jgi:hypothetical protein